MLIRKAIPFLIIFSAGAFFGRPLALGGLGLIAKAYLFYHEHLCFSYDSVDWKDGCLIFSKADVAQKNSFHLHAKQIKASLGSKFLKFDSPRITVFKKPQLSEGSDWMYVMKDGTIFREGLGEVQFSCERNWPSQIGNFFFKKDGAECDLELIREGKEIWVDAQFHQFDMGILQEWIDVQGQVDGQMHLVFNEGVYARGSARLDIQAGGYGRLVSAFDGSIDWDGEDKRFRLDLSRGIIHPLEGGRIELQGEFSFHAGLGAKWEFDGIGNAKELQFPLLWEGKAFLQDSREHWMESKAVLGDSELLFHGKQKDEQYALALDCIRLGAAEGFLLRPLISMADERLNHLDFCKGLFLLHADAVVSREDFFQDAAAQMGAWLPGTEKSQSPPKSTVFWEVTLSAEQFAGKYSLVSLDCETFDFRLSSSNAGAFSFDALSFDIPCIDREPIIGKGWNGEGHFNEGALSASHFEGHIDSRHLEASLSGTANAFALQLFGAEGRANLTGQWKEERLSWDLREGIFGGLFFTGRGWVDPSTLFEIHLDRFYGKLTPCLEAFGLPESLNGEIFSVGAGFFASGSFSSYDWSLQARGEFGNGMGFYCPVLEKKGEQVLFDFRIENQNTHWDWGRLCGVWEDGMCFFDADRTQILGTPIQIKECIWNKNGLSKLQLSSHISMNPFLYAVCAEFPSLQEGVFQAEKFKDLSIEGDALLALSFIKGGASFFSIDGQNLTWEGAPLPFHFFAVEDDGVWQFLDCQIGQCFLSGKAHWEEPGLRFCQGAVHYDNALRAEFEGMIGKDFRYAMDCSFFSLDLEKIGDWIPWAELRGTLEGKGCFSSKETVEADFDCTASDLAAFSMSWEQEGPIHLSYSSDRGILCSGIALQVPDKELHAKIELLQFDLNRSVWVFDHSRIYLPPHAIGLFSKHLDCFNTLKEFDPGMGIDLLVDFEFPSDFSYLSCFAREGLISKDGVVRSVRDLSLSFSGPKNDLHCSMLYLHQGESFKVSAEASWSDALSGRFYFEEAGRPLEKGERPLCIDWTYRDGKGFSIHEIEGKCAGIDASFHALDEGTCLIGSARVHFGILASVVPAEVAQVFRDLEMGKGYELKGRLFLDESGPSFRGLLSGKQIELFGYQFRTLLGHIELGAERIHIYDLKISDSAGIMKIDSIQALGIGENPWTIAIPRLIVSELRPSLLQKAGEEAVAEPAGPLVIRELKIEDFKGLLDDSKTYTAAGELTFINSYRREHTVFDLPADVLGRIVGLDLELLIPVCGTLSYTLKDGVFQLTQLRNAYSEGMRSEFFLESDPAPMMDLDGNLRLFVNMKQFVLFKFTESFSISINGKLNDPQYNLQKKRRFLGL